VTPGKIAFVSERDGNSEIYVINSDGTGLTRLTDNPAREKRAPVWSPDGKRIAFSSCTETPCDIYIMNADGTEKTTLTQGAAGPAWSPEGTRIAHDGGGVIRVFSFDDRTTFRIDLPLQSIAMLRWSPDGERIAFQAIDLGGEGDFGVYVVDVNVTGTGLIRLIDDPSRGANYPSWSPDSEKVAVTSKKDGNPEIYVVNADGTGIERLTNDPLWNISPDWSPDGSKIAFTRYKPMDCTTIGEIFLMNPDGSDLTQLTSTPDFCSAYSRWSPDGKQIAFISKGGEEDVRDVYVINVDGTGQTNLTNNPAEDRSPEWAP
jgi:Tol biopolymer transport system component